MFLMKALLRFFIKIFQRVIVKSVYEIKGFELLSMLRSRDTVQDIILWDGIYKFTDFEVMLRIIKGDMVKWHEYRVENYDCDNFAITFAGIIPYVYGINSVGIAVGKVTDDNGYVGYHAWNVFVAMKSNGEPCLYMYEPQTGKFTTYKSGRIGNWEYEPEYIIWG